MTGLPDPSDRSRPWHGDQPAYFAHYHAAMDVRAQTGHLAWHPLVHSYSEAIPTLKALQLLASLSPLVEIGAGIGYWARLLADCGADIVASDIAAPDSNSWTAGSQPWTTVIVCDALTAVRRHPDRVLFACWPPRPTGYKSTVLPVYEGRTLALITDDPLDTGHDPLYGSLERDWSLSQRLDLPHWPARHDSLMIWRRKVSRADESDGLKRPAVQTAAIGLSTTSTLGQR